MDNSSENSWSYYNFLTSRDNISYHKEEINMTYENNQRDWLDKNPEIKVGSFVVVTSSWDKLSSQEKNKIGWSLSYHSAMDSFIGQIHKVVDISNHNGVCVYDEKIRSSFWYPYCVLSPFMKDIYILFPDEKTQAIKSLEIGNRIIANKILGFTVESKVFFVSGDIKINALGVYNRFLGATGIEFINSIILF